jgi:hypothetical protein
LEIYHQQISAVGYEFEIRNPLNPNLKLSPQVIIHKVPSVLDGNYPVSQPSDFLEFLHQLQDQKGSSVIMPNGIHRTLASVACKGILHDIRGNFQVLNFTEKKVQ